jgi:hypothetical protein
MAHFLRCFLVLALTLAASAVSAQSVYVAVSAGSDTILASRIEVQDQITEDAGGTAPFVGARVGMALGSRWGTEVEVAYRFREESTREQRLGSDIVVLPGLVIPAPVATIETSTAITSFSPSVWVAQAVANRLDLVFHAGVAFNRTQSTRDVRFDARRVQATLVPLPPNIGVITPIRTLTPAVPSTKLTVYDVEPLVGIDARIGVGSRLRVTPGLRMSGIGGWSVRPSVAVGWMF